MWLPMTAAMKCPRGARRCRDPGVLLERGTMADCASRPSPAATSRTARPDSLTLSQLLGETPEAESMARTCMRLAESLLHTRSRHAFLLGRRRAIRPTTWASARRARPRGARRGRAGRAVSGHLPGIAEAERARGPRGEPASDVAIVPAADSLAGRARWVIVNYDILSRHLDAIKAIARATSWWTRRTIKNHKSARSRDRPRHRRRCASDRVGRRPPVYALTGTPLTNRPRDLFRCCGWWPTRLAAASCRCEALLCRRENSMDG
jgi:hypothetical protein